MPVLFVRAGGAAAGAGTMDAPFGTIAEALAAAAPGAIVALGKGTFDEAVQLTTEVTLWGSCVEESIVRASVGFPSGVLRITSGSATVRDLQVTGERPGISVSGDGAVDLQDVLVASPTFLGISVDAPGASVTGQSVVVRDVLGPPGTLGRGLSVTAGGSMTFTRVAVERARDVAVFVSDAGSTLALEDAAIQDSVGDGIEGLGLEVFDGSASVLRSDLGGNRDSGAFVLGLTGRLVLEDVVVHDTRSNERAMLYGRGVDAADGASLEARRVAILRNREAGLSVSFGSTATLEDVVVQETQPTEADGTLGRGVVIEASTTDGQRLWIDGSHDLGLAVAGTSTAVTLQDVLVRGTQSTASDGTFGNGLYAFDGAIVELERALFEDNHESGVGAAGADVSLTDVEVRGTLGRESDGASGRGLNLQSGSHAVVARGVFAANRESALFLSDEGTELVASDVRVEDTDGDIIARGLTAESGARAEIVRGAFARNREASIVALQPGTSIRLEEVSVVDTLERRCVDTSCPGLGGGIGVGAYLEAVLEMSRFLVARAALTGVQLARDGEMDLHEGEVSDCPIGANVQTEGYDAARLSDRVVYRRNGANLDAAELLVPFSE